MIELEKKLKAFNSMTRLIDELLRLSRMEHIDAFIYLFIHLLFK